MAIDRIEEEDRKKIDLFFESVHKSAEYYEMLKTLSPLVQAISGSDALRNSLRFFMLALKNRMEKSAKRMKIFREDSRAPCNSEIQTLRKTFVYLGLFETSATELMDLILMLFMLNGYDLIDSKGRRAKNLDDLDHMSPYDKLDFLDEHGLQVISQYANRKLRNSIAHLDFDVKRNGKIAFDETEYDLEEEIEKLMGVILAVARALQDLGVQQLY